ncbi:RluA family pseudouridine synthase [Candidatus Saganbacteria bacterium]|nr:RluA family pseudouridine synthase [Candidatus Saganbacteria bacterium]
MSAKFEYIINNTQINQRLDHFLAAQKESRLTRSQIQKLIDNCDITVNKKKSRPAYKLKLNDKIIVTIPSIKPLETSPENIPLNIVYEDSDIIVINKPRGLVVHPAVGNYSGTLVNALLNHCQDLSGIGGVERPGIVHRLDKDTTGLIVVAKNDLAHQSLSKQFKNKTVHKKYLALVHGIVKQDSGTIAARIGRHPVQRKKMAVVGTRGREAVTHFQVKARFKNFTLLELILETGRTHQIRVHLSSIGYPIVGDQTYGKKQNEFDLNGQFLHAAELSFTHPRTGQILTFSAPLPEDMDKIIDQLSNG